jgi:hypothetical protein
MIEKGLCTPNTWPGGLADVREEVTKAENVAELVDERFHLLFPRLGEHLGIDDQLVTARVGKERARQDASVEVAVVAPPQHDFEVVDVVAFGKLDRHRVTPRQQGIAQEVPNLGGGGRRIFEEAQRGGSESPSQRHVLGPQRDETLGRVEDYLVERSPPGGGVPARIRVANEAVAENVDLGIRLADGGFRLPVLKGLGSLRYGDPSLDNVGSWHCGAPS